MTTSSSMSATLASRSYAALRHGGAPPWKARTQLDLPPRLAARFEKLFQARAGAGGDAMKPRFARHGQHVAAVMQAGGFPVLREPRR